MNTNLKLIFPYFYLPVGCGRSSTRCRCGGRLRLGPARPTSAASSSGCHTAGTRAGRTGGHCFAATSGGFGLGSLHHDLLHLLHVRVGGLGGGGAGAAASSRGGRLGHRCSGRHGCSATASLGRRGGHGGGLDVPCIHESVGQPGGAGGALGMAPWLTQRQVVPGILLGLTRRVLDVIPPSDEPIALWRTVVHALRLFVTSFLPWNMMPGEYERSMAEAAAAIALRNRRRHAQH